VAFRVVQKDEYFTGLAIFHGGRHRAVVVAQDEALLVYMVEDIVTAIFPNDLIGCIPGDFFCPLAPICDDPVSVQIVYAILQAVQDFFEEAIVHISPVVMFKYSSTKYGVERSSTLNLHLDP
jgi:hypothetical protein